MYSFHYQYVFFLPSNKLRWSSKNILKGKLSSTTERCQSVNMLSTLSSPHGHDVLIIPVRQQQWYTSFHRVGTVIRLTTIYAFGTETHSKDTF